MQSRITTMQRRGGLALALATTLGTTAMLAQAQSEYPNRPVRFVVPYPPGGGTDFTAREMGQRLSEAFGQTFVIDNRPGAGATLGHGLVAKAAPDGYTILLSTTGGIVSGPALGVKVPYDPLKGFSHIGFLVHVPYAVVTFAGLAPNNVRELIDLARASPGKFNLGSPGTGTPNHLGGVMLMVLTGVKLVHVPYKGGGPMMTDLMSGQVHLAFSSPPQALPHVRSGRVKMLGVGHPTRVKMLPDIPAINETVPGFINTGWWGISAPPGTPKDIVARLNAAVNKALALPDVEKKFAANGVIAAPGTPTEFQSFIQEDFQRWRKIIKEANLSVD